MDLVLDFCDENFLTPYVYPSWLPHDNILRQGLTLLVLSSLGGHLLYLSAATLSYFILFDKTLMEHPLIIKSQIKLEIQYALWAIPLMGCLTVPIFLLEVNGYSKLYDNIQDTKLGFWTIPINAVTFIAFTDCLIYWIHRGLHNKLIYKYTHKPHHHWKVPTPFASHAFHPIDGFSQSLPYHIYPFLFPLHKLTYLGLFLFVNLWTVSIHDGYYSVPNLIKPFVNGSAHHTDHHLYYNYNYGQFFTLWDRIGGSFKNPSSFEGTGPADEVLRRKKQLANEKNN